MSRDLFGATLGSDVLSARQRRAPGVARQADQILGHKRHGSPRAFLPRRVRRRVDDNLTDHSPPGVVGVAARNEKPRERLCHPERLGLRAVAVEMS